MSTPPSKVTAVYWTQWNPQIRLTAVPQGYNLLYLFAASKSGTEGGLAWSPSSIGGDIKTCRARGQLVVLSCGGAGNGINFSTRAVSTRFVDSVVRINTELGGTLTNPVIDGVDFNTFEAEAAPNTPEYQWIVAELRRRFGSGFAVTSPPAPWSQRDKEFCKTMLASGSMDYAAPQYYDGPGLSSPDYIVNSVNEWIRDVAGGNAAKIAVGFGIAAAPNYSTIDQIKNAWNRIESAHPNIRGVFLWQHKTDADGGWQFANQIIPLVGPSTVTPIPIPPPVDQKKVTIGGSSYPLAGTNIPRAADALVIYDSKAGATTSTNVYGAEAPVLGTKVQSSTDRQTTGGPGVAIPQDGYVLSGHGAARVWLMENAKVGSVVTGDVPKPPEPVSPYYAPEGSTLDEVRQKHNALVKHLGL